MRKSVSLIAILALAATAPAYAGQASKEETIGVGSGAVIGAAAAGPVGFIIGAAIGAKLGDTMHRKSARIDNLSTDLRDSETNVGRLEDQIRQMNADLDDLGSEIERMHTLARPEVVKLLEAGIAMDLLFRTDESTLADSTGTRLITLAGTLAAMPEIRIQLDGFADERGDEQYNFRLSQKRVEFVRDRLVAAGVNPSRINLTANGESPAADATPDSYALERRVSLTLFIDDSQPFASQPN